MLLDPVDFVAHGFRDLLTELTDELDAALARVVKMSEDQQSFVKARRNEATQTGAATDTGNREAAPRINPKAGRDHWGNICPLALIGGGLRMGQVVGQSDRQGGEPATTPVTVQNLMATIMHTLFDIGQLRITRGVPTDVLRTITAAEPIRELV